MVSKPTSPDQKLVLLISKAHDWLARLTTGKYDSVLAIAKAEKVSSSHVTHVIYLAFLAPDIVERIVRGQHPIELNAHQLIRKVPLPMDWVEQRKS